MKTVKTAVLLIMVLGISLAAECQKPAEKNKIKSIIVTEEKQDMIVKKQFTESETYYDIKGNVIEEKTYKQGKINKHFRYYYDGDNNKIKEEELDASDKIIETSEYKIENGLRTEKTVFDSYKKVKSKKYYKYTTY